VIAAAGILPRDARRMTPRELDIYLKAATQRQAREWDARAWGVAHILAGLGATARGLTIRHIMRMLLGRDPVSLMDDEADRGLNPEQSVQFMRQFVAEQLARVERVRA
jgi:hypothetical protein